MAVHRMLVLTEILRHVCGMATTEKKPADARSSSVGPLAKKAPPPAKTDWKRFVGWAKNDPTYEEALRIGAEYRRSMTWEKEMPARDADS
jgi:hypothetical protein